MSWESGEVTSVNTLAIRIHSQTGGRNVYVDKHGTTLSVLIHEEVLRMCRSLRMISRPMKERGYLCSVVRIPVQPDPSPCGNVVPELLTDSSSHSHDLTTLKGRKATTHWSRSCLNHKGSSADDICTSSSHRFWFRPNTLQEAYSSGPVALSVACLGNKHNGYQLAHQVRFLCVRCVGRGNSHYL